MVKYSKAPISEVVLGITFDNPIFQIDNAIFEILAHLKKKYSNITIHAPIANEEMKEYRLLTGVDLNSAGPGVYRMRSGKFMVQIQLNKLYLNWIRGDNELVGDYPGFSDLIDRFIELFEEIIHFVRKKDSNLDVFSHIKYYELMYQDRFSWQEYIDDLSELNRLINIKSPEINNFVSNNMFFTYTIPIDDISGFSKLSLNTNTSKLGKQIIVLDNNMKGNDGLKDIKGWFDKAHELQIKFFEEMINDQLLKRWR